MSRYRRIWVVYRKELVETLRDKRTLAAMILVPIVLYPVLMVIIVEALRAETGRRQAERYSIAVPTEEHRQWLTGVLKRAVADERGSAAAGPEFLSATLRADQVDIDVVDAARSLWDMVADQAVHAAVLCDPPPNPADPVDATNRIVQIIHCETNPRSEFVYGQLGAIMAQESDRIVRERVSRMPGGAANLTPILTNALSTSSPEQQFARILAMVVPFLLVIMTVTGALYPAIDLTAGERERGTLETLAVSPVPTAQIVAGKFGVIVTIAMFSTSLNLGSMTAMFHFSKLAQLAASPRSALESDGRHVEQIILGRGGQQYDSGSPQRENIERRRKLEEEGSKKAGFLTTAAPVVLLAMLPFAVLASGVMLATCCFARTFKEAQNYMMPVMLAFMIPSMIVSYMPTTRLEGLLLVIPVANIVVLIRDLFLGNHNAHAMGICLLSTCFYAAAAMSVAARVYGHEAVLFSDVGSYKTLLRRRFMKPRPAPSPAAALLGVALLFPVYFYWQSYLIDLEAGGARMRLVLAGSQVFVLALPVVLLCWYLKLGMRSTFSLRMPRSSALLAALLLGVSIVPVANLLRQIQYAWIPPVMDGFEAQAEPLLTGPFASVLVVLAVLPAICEELLFRGFLLSGLRQKLSGLSAAVVVGLIFGLFHLRVEQIPVHSLIGMLLALACYKSGSILPAMVVHLLNNALPLVATRVPSMSRVLGLDRFAADPSTPSFSFPTAAYLAVFLIGLVLIARRPRNST